MHSTRTSAMKVAPEDNLVVALRDLNAGERVEVNGEVFELTQDVKSKHKFAANDFSTGEVATMYGVTVGQATQPIPKGGLLTTENLVHLSAEYGEPTEGMNWEPPDVSRWEESCFDGYHRADGSVGTANHWLVVPMVFCENGNVQLLKEAMQKSLGYERRDHYQLYAQELAEACKAEKDLACIDLPEESSRWRDPLFPNVDGVKFILHGMGCGETRGISNDLCGLIAGYLNNANVAGATILSLGCQHAQVSILEEEIEKRNPAFDKPMLVFEQQKHKSEREMLGQAIRQTFESLQKANEISREPSPLSKLTIGMECGASDGFSGISANPALGKVADFVVALGGRVILSEFPELCGVEQEIVNRCASPEVGKRFVEIMRNYEARAKEAGSGFHMNPSPGNVRDGLITDAIKSAGAARKGGSSPVVDALDYPGWVTKQGLSLLCTAGNDVESTTAMAGAGANLQLFSTGLGTPTGNPVTPVIKVSSNSKLADSFSDYIDFDTGHIISGEKSVEATGQELLDEVIEYASGRKTAKAMLQGRDDFLPWKRGMSL